MADTSWHCMMCSMLKVCSLPLQNQFISLLLTIQNKRRQYNVEKKKKNKNGATLDAKVTADEGSQSGGFETAGTILNIGVIHYPWISIYQLAAFRGVPIYCHGFLLSCPWIAIVERIVRQFLDASCWFTHYVSHRVNLLLLCVRGVLRGALRASCWFVLHMFLFTWQLVGTYDIGRIPGLLLKRLL